MTLEEAGRHLKMGKATFYKLARLEKVPSRKMGRAWRLDAAELDERLKAGKLALLERRGQ